MMTQLSCPLWGLRRMSGCVLKVRISTDKEKIPMMTQLSCPLLLAGLLASTAQGALLDAVQCFCHIRLQSPGLGTGPHVPRAK